LGPAQETKRGRSAQGELGEERPEWKQEAQEEALACCWALGLAMKQGRSKPEAQEAQACCWARLELTQEEQGGKTLGEERPEWKQEAQEEALACCWVLGPAMKQGRSRREAQEEQSGSTQEEQGGSTQEEQGGSKQGELGEEQQEWKQEAQEEAQACCWPQQGSMQGKLERQACCWKRPG
jgi:hypothetical protein